MLSARLTQVDGDNFTFQGRNETPRDDHGRKHKIGPNTLESEDSG